jgi:hypothetical protein
VVKASRTVIERVRKIVLERDENMCQLCGANVLYKLASLQHRRPRGMGGSAQVWDASNLILLCGSATTPGSCHNHVEHEDRAEAERLGYLIPKLSPLPTTAFPVWTYLHGWVLLDDEGGRQPCEPVSA